MRILLSERHPTPTEKTTPALNGFGSRNKPGKQAHPVCKLMESAGSHLRSEPLQLMFLQRQ
jgi:hypothetical protein